MMFLVSSASVDVRQTQLMNSNRYGEAKSAYREVQERHEDIKKIEKTLTELAQLFNDVSTRWPYASEDN